MLKFAANLSWMYTELPANDRFAAAAKDGFTAVEILSPYAWPAADLATRLQAHGLELVLFNAHHETIPFKLPDYAGSRWQALLDTAQDDGLSADGTFDAGAEYALQGRSLVLLQQVSA